MEELKKYEPIKFKVGQSYEVLIASTGKTKIFKCTNVLRRKSTKERVYVEGSFDGKKVQRYEIKIINKYNDAACEQIDVDKRYICGCAASDIIE